MRVGRSQVSLRFRRRKDGTSDYEVLEKQGALHVFHQPSPWSLTAGSAERIVDALTSFLPAK